MTANYRLGTDVKSVIKALLTPMTQVDHDTISIHLSYDFLTKLTNSSMRITASCRVTNIVISVVTKRDVNHTSLCEVLDVLDLMLQS